MPLPLTFLERSRVALRSLSVPQCLLQNVFVFSFFLPSHLKGRLVFDPFHPNSPLIRLPPNPCSELLSPSLRGFQHPQHNTRLAPSLFLYYGWPTLLSTLCSCSHLQPQVQPLGLIVLSIRTTDKSRPQHGFSLIAIFLMLCFMWSVFPPHSLPGGHLPSSRVTSSLKPVEINLFLDLQSTWTDTVKKSLCCISPHAFVGVFAAPIDTTKSLEAGTRLAHVSSLSF